ncbi:carboxypeptidase regulatory-like domain-containing protein [uncultured Mucilaginibacter sp.]|uniref:TonB-dependent receptor n=1 Tax=uncultured Mucilaginibacter sp. TaxID=797541 RepID=UPI0025F2DAB9|nr:carboxypeptidase regulatory-like domain-containing protein [uncultured Mucilaginibacter sp.]
MRKFLLLLIVFVATTFTASQLMAQGVTTASMHGVVTDTKGATLPGATVVVTHVPTGTVYSASTRADGRYNIPNLRVGGPYTVKISFIGFKDYVEENITLSIGQDQTVSTKLLDNTSTLKEVTVVGAQGKVINSNRTGARETISRAQIDALPTLNRSLTDFTKLTPSANGLSFGGRSSLYNNITVDGALFNNSFGLSGTLGGQTNSQPISLDAIDQIQVDLAPYDVRQGNFTGAGVNTVIKSGTNEIKGTVYDYLRSVALTGYQAGTTGLTITPLSYHSDGASIGGPIIPNKLFLFVSGEQERISAPANTFIATAPGISGSNVSQVKASDLDALSSYLQSNYGYNPGPYQGYNYVTYSDKVTTKLDWNINKNNTLSAKYFYLKSYKDQPTSTSTSLYPSRVAGVTGLPFYGNGYRINNNFNIGILELDTRVSNTMSNKLTVGYSALRDYRSSLGTGNKIPMVDIGNGSGVFGQPGYVAATATATSFGEEQFTEGNLLSSNIFQFSDDYTIYAGKHEITIGTNDQIQSYTNGFATQYDGVYSYNSFSDFENNLPAARFSYRYSALPDGSFPYAHIKGQVFSLYAEDKWQANDNLKITYGVRADYESFPTALQANPNVPPLTFQQGIHVDPSVLPASRVEVSPRFGFNWDVFGNQKTQVRGGTGLFAGQTPFVWISNQASNNGVLFGSQIINRAGTTNAGQDSRLTFNPNPDAYHTGAGAANTSYELDITDPNLKLPKIWRTNIAIDQKLPLGFIGTIEAAYTKDINAIYHQNLVLSDATTTLPGPDYQLHYNSSNITPQSGATAANPTITGLYYMTNTNQGYSYFVTGQLQRSFLNGFQASIAYTYNASKDVNDGGSTASSIWSGRPVAGNPNADNLSNSSYYQPNRVIATVAYKKEYAKNFASSIGLTMESANNGTISYVYNGDVNGDGQTSNDLMYIPAAQNDLEIVAAGGTDPRTATQEWNQLNNFINQDPYLSKHRGQYAERNGATLPLYQMYNLNLTQDFYVKSGKYKNTIRVTFDIINLGNFLNKYWGLAQVSAITGGTGNVSLLKYTGVIDPVTGKQEFTVPYLNTANQTTINNSYQYDTSQFSRWQAQLGLRYIFN